MHELWVRPRPDARGYRRDAGAAVLLAVGATVSALLYSRVGLFADPAPLWLCALVLAGLTLPLALRRRFPEVVAVVIAVAFFVGTQFTVPEMLFNNIALFIAIYTVGAWGRNRRVANLVRGAIIAAMFIWISVNLVVAANDPEVAPDFSRSGVFSQLAAFAVIQVLTNLLYFGGAYYFGNSMFAAAAQRADLEARTTELSREREHSSAQAVALDRVRIARELHDVVAHHVSVMGVQAGAARRVVQSDPALASESLELIEKSARAAVEELHRLLTTLREQDTDAAATSSSTLGVAQLDDLVDETIAAGTAAELRVIGDPRPVSALVGFTLYRVAQEALTNVRKHAGPQATADLRLRFDQHGVELEVADTGIGKGLATHPPGLGQTGMRERVAAVGGDIEFGPRSRGGYLVRAHIPLEAEEAAPPTPARSLRPSPVEGTA